MTRRRALISVGSVAACALAYELAVRTLADRDLVGAAAGGELVPLALDVTATSSIEAARETVTRALDDVWRGPGGLLTAAGEA